MFFANMPIVTVGIPAFNAEKTIRHTLESILAQGYEPLEIVVSDNHSTDNTIRIVEEFAGRGVRWTTCPVIAHTGDAMGISLSAVDNFNHLLGQGSGEYLALFHADDVYDENIVEKEVKFLEAHQEVGAVFTMGRTIDEDGRTVGVQRRRLPAAFAGGAVFSQLALLNAVMLYGSFLMTPTVMARRSILEKVGGMNKRHQQGADYDWWFRIARAAGIGVLDEALFSHRISASQDSRKGRLFYRRELLPVFAVIEDLLADPDLRSAVTKEAILSYQVAKGRDLLRIARSQLAAGEESEALSRLEEAKALFASQTVPRTYKIIADILAGRMLEAGAKLGLGKKMASLQIAMIEWRNSRKLLLR